MSPSFFQKGDGNFKLCSSPTANLAQYPCSLKVAKLDKLGQFGFAHCGSSIPFTGVSIIDKETTALESSLVKMDDPADNPD
jgi:hypothetical protein